MRKLTAVLAAFVAVLALSMPSQARLRIGPRVGIDVSSLHFNQHIFDKENRVGFTAGLQADLTLPFGFGFDASVMYARRSIEAVSSTTTIKAKRDYINVPINLKWGLNLPAINKVFIPYVFTGPDFAFLASKRAISDAWNSHKVDVSWNVGVGIELVRHLQFSATYGMGMTKLGHTLGITNQPHDDIEGRNNNWTVTVAWLF